MDTLAFYTADARSQKVYSHTGAAFQSTNNDAMIIKDKRGEYRRAVRVIHGYVLVHIHN